MITTFFDTNNYFIDEKVNFLKFENSYKIYNDKGEKIGEIKEKLNTAQKLLRLVLNKAMLPFLLEIKSSNGDLVGSISREWTLFMSKITIKNHEGTTIGIVKQKFKLFKPTFKIYSYPETLIAEITGDWKAWDFKIHDTYKQQIGTISKKWAGAFKELFTSADKYKVSIEPNYSNINNKILILTTAITIDMVLKENK